MPERIVSFSKYFSPNKYATVLKYTPTMKNLTALDLFTQVLSYRRYKDVKKNCFLFRRGEKNKLPRSLINFHARLGVLFLLKPFAVVLYLSPMQISLFA